MRTPFPRIRRVLTSLMTLAFLLIVGLGIMRAVPAGAQIPVPGGIQANAGGPYAGSVGQPIVFSGTLLSSFGFGVSQFQWSFGDGGSGFGQTATHAYLAPGTYFVTLTVIDPSGLSSSASTTAIVGGGIQPLPPAPIGVSAGGPYSGGVGTLITFAGSVGASILPYQYTYFWNFGDGGTGSGLNAAHAYSTSGVFTVTLTVTAANGQVGSGTTTANISQAISVSAGTSTTGVVGRSVAFGATVRGSTNPQVTWTYGDGGTGTGQFTTHVYNNPGNFTATVTAVDPSGSQASDSIGVTISPSLVIDANGPYTGIVGRPLALEATASGSASAQFRWDFGDGATGVGPNPTHTFATAGTYTIMLSATSGAQTASDTATAIIQPGGPVVSYPAGWNIVGGPSGTLFSQSGSPLYTIQPGDAAYEVLRAATTGVKAGAGYWAYFNSLTTVTLSGTSQDSTMITVPAGQFVMIGNPNANAAVTIRGADTAVSWDPTSSTWKDVSSLAPGAGAWVVVRNGGTVTLSP